MTKQRSQTERKIRIDFGTLRYHEERNQRHGRCKLAITNLPMRKERVMQIAKSITLQAGLALLFLATPAAAMPRLTGGAVDYFLMPFIGYCSLIVVAQCLAASGRRLTSKR